MGEGSNDPASKDLLPPDIPTLVQRCLKVEQDRSLSDNSMKELRRYLSEFPSYCQGKNIYFAYELRCPTRPYRRALPRNWRPTPRTSPGKRHTDRRGCSSGLAVCGRGWPVRSETAAERCIVEIV